MLWPGDWDGTFASHPRKSEGYVSSGERRREGGLVGVIIGKLFAIGLTLIPGARLENADVPMWAVF